LAMPGRAGFHVWNRVGIHLQQIALLSSVSRHWLWIANEARTSTACRRARVREGRGRWTNNQLLHKISPVTLIDSSGLRPLPFSFHTGWLMTYRSDVARGRDIVARWCALAEQRLQYLTELFDTGRWRRFHSEAAFLENVHEAKAAVEIWRELLRRETSPDIAPIDISWPDRTRADPVRERSREQIGTPQAVPARAEVAVAPRLDIAVPDQAPFARSAAVPVQDSLLDLSMDIASIEQRYPLLRNAL
jgi:uncharacterized repeat protein (TIGR03809 family)